MALRLFLPTHSHHTQRSKLAAPVTDSEKKATSCRACTPWQVQRSGSRVNPLIQIAALRLVQNPEPQKQPHIALHSCSAAEESNLGNMSTYACMYMYTHAHTCT